MCMPKPMHAARRLSFGGAVDADGHILEPPDLWERYLEPKYRDRALRCVTTSHDGFRIFRTGTRPYPSLPS